MVYKSFMNVDKGMYVYEWLCISEWMHVWKGVLYKSMHEFSRAIFNIVYICSSIEAGSVRVSSTLITRSLMYINCT